MDLVQIVEAIIFAAPEPVSAKDVARAIRRTAKAALAASAEEENGENEDKVDTPPPKKKSQAKKKKIKDSAEIDPENLQNISSKQIYGIIEEINETYNATGRPMHLVEGPAGWRFYTRIEYASYIRGLMPDVKPERFSGPAMETLAIIAYRQPVTKADIEAVRGVSVDGVLNKIIDRGLVKIGGRADLPGKPLLYETSETFLEHFGIKNIDDLPNSGELRRIELPTAEISEEGEAEGEEQLSLGDNAEEGKGENESTESTESTDDSEGNKSEEEVEAGDESTNVENSEDSPETVEVGEDPVKED